MAARALVNGVDQALHLESVESLHRASPYSRGAQAEFSSCLFDHLFGLVVAEVVLLPELDGFEDYPGEGFRFIGLTAKFLLIELFFYLIHGVILGESLDSFRSMAIPNCKKWPNSELT